MSFSSRDDDRPTGYNGGMGFGGSGRSTGSAGSGNSGSSRSGAAGQNAGRSSSSSSSSSRSGAAGMNSGRSSSSSSSRSGASTGNTSRGDTPSSGRIGGGFSSDRSGTGFGGLLGSRSGPGGAGGVRNTTTGTRQSTPASRVGSLLGGGMIPTPREHPFRDASRFGYGMGMTPDNLSRGLEARGLLSQLSQLANAQTDFGKRLQVNDALAMTGHRPKGAHPMGLAFDVQVPDTMDRGPFIESATRAGFTHTGTYGVGKRGVHVDTRPGTGTWGETERAASTPGWHRDAVASGLASGPMDMADVASKIAGSSPTYAGMAPSLANAVQQTSRPNLDSRIAAMQNAMPQAQASNIPTPNEQVGGYLGNMAGLTPGPSRSRSPAPATTQQPYSGPAMAQYGFAPSQGIDRTTAVMASPLSHEFENNSKRRAIADAMERGAPGLMNAIMSGAPSTNIEDRRSVSGMSFNPGLPERFDPGAGIVASASDYGRNPLSAGMSFNPGMPGQMPGPSRSRSPAVNGEPQVASTPNPGRSFAGIPSSGFPNYQNPGRSFAGIPGNGLPGYSNPGRSFAGVPGSGFPQDGVATAQPEDDPNDPIAQPPQQMAEAAPQAPSTGSWLDRAKSWTESKMTPEQKEKLQYAKDHFNMARFAVPPSPAEMAQRQAHQQTRQGGPAVPIPGNGPGGQWVGNEAPQQVAAMQQAVVEVLRQYFTNAAAPLNQYSTTGGTLAG